MTTNTDPTVFIVAVDGGPSDSHVIEVAARAAAKEAPAELHIIHVIRATARDTTRLASAMVFPTFTELMEEGKQLLDRLTAEAARELDGRIIGHLAVGEPWREIVQIASNLRADMIVVGTADRGGLPRLFLGSVAARVVRKAQCPVLVARRIDYHSRVVPEIDPPCTDCLATQRETKRVKLWCDRHASTHVHGRLHYETAPGYGAGSMFIRP